MYSWDRDLHEKKYESIQHGYEVAEYYDEEADCGAAADDDAYDEFDRAYDVGVHKC